MVEREFRASIDDVWEAVTESERRAHWIGGDVSAVDFDRDYYPAMAAHYREQV